jgi:glutamyl-tRNA reductase
MPLLERLTLSRDNRAQQTNQLKEALGVDELTYLATCNRVDILYVTSRLTSPEQLLHRLLDFFFLSGRKVPFFPNDFYHYTGRDAVTHLFRTASSLDSMVVGETQISGQLKQALQEAIAACTVGPHLENLINESLLVARRVKRDTNIGAGALSMASLAVGALNEHLCRETAPRIALVGAGPMTSKLANYLSELGHSNLVFVNRTVANIAGLAQEMNAPAIALDEFIAQPPEVSAIVSATGSTEVVFDRCFLERLSERAQPIVCIDLAVPRDFETEFARSPKVRYLDIPGLKAQGNDNLRQKFIEAGKAESIVRDSVTRYFADRLHVSLKPIFQSSYQESLTLAHQAMADLFANQLSKLEESERESLVRLVSKLIGNAAFNPVRVLSERLAQLTGDSRLADFEALHRESA